MNDFVSSGTLVWYHGTKRDCHSFGKVTHSASGTGYYFSSVDADIQLYNVSRDSFTIVPIPELPEPTLEPGFYKHTDCVGGRDFYALTPDGRWVFIPQKNDRFADPETLSAPVYPLRDLVKWEG